MEKPIRKNYENDELFFDAVAEYLKKSERKKLTYICIGLEPEDAKVFKNECKASGLNMSEKVRELIKDFIYPFRNNI
jgi:hypothetical protein